jgi:hypothetical protein
LTANVRFFREETVQEGLPVERDETVVSFSQEPVLNDFGVRDFDIADVVDVAVEYIEDFLGGAYVCLGVK